MMKSEVKRVWLLWCTYNGYAQCMALEGVFISKALAKESLRRLQAIHAELNRTYSILESEVVTQGESK